MRTLMLSLILAAAARAETRTYVIAVGNNLPPAGEAPLRYADDDAADFYSFVRPLARDGWLLTVLDADSQRHFPGLVAATRAPSLAELDRVVARLRERMDEDTRAGHAPVLLFFYSGHGTRGTEDQPPSLVLLDGPLTQAVLYDRVLQALPARYVHLFVDACHAEAVVRPRDASAAVVQLDDSDVRSYAARATLDRFPNVGAVVATSSTALAHEWDLYQRGVFSHEVISGLRGAADVNGDGLVEYSELQAFVSAANSRVSDGRARLELVARPPALNRRAPLVDLRASAGRGFLLGHGGELGAIWIEDGLGNRLADLNVEAGYEVYLTLPAEKLYLHAGGREALLAMRAGAVARLERMSWHMPQLGARGSLDDALQRGLFAAVFGPRYYQGFADRDAAPVSLASDEVGELLRSLGGGPPRAPSRSRTGVALVSAGAVLAGAGVALAALAGVTRTRYDETPWQNPSRELNDRYTGYTAGAAISLGLSAAALGVGGWLLARSHR